MARPRIFISSTYFDLKSIREELDRFVSTMGYEPVRHEAGQVSYGKDESPEFYAYKEVEFCDVLVSIIGSKYGTDSTEGGYSISQRELKGAHDAGKQVYIFVDDAVLSEYKFYQSNKDVAGVKFTAVTDVRIYAFIDEMYALPRGNPIFSFKTGAELIQILRDQWAGLFQRLLTQETGRKQTALTEQLQESLQTVGQLVKFLQESHTTNTSQFQDILLTNHPFFINLRKVTNTQHRLFFANLKEIDDWLTSTRGYFRLKDDEVDADDDYTWMSFSLMRQANGKSNKRYRTLRIAKSLFDVNGGLKPVGPTAWQQEWVRHDISESKPPRFPDDDDIPF